jgi:hypothetical protein
MVKFGLLTIMITAATALGVATLSTPSASADPPATCFRKTFKTKMIKAACAGTVGKPGTQLDAKAAMRKFVADHQITQCAECHADLAPNYPLKDTALKHYKELGGE